MISVLDGALRVVLLFGYTCVRVTVTVASVKVGGYSETPASRIFTTPGNRASSETPTPRPDDTHYLNGGREISNYWLTGTRIRSENNATQIPKQNDIGKAGLRGHRGIINRILRLLPPPARFFAQTSLPFSKEAPFSPSPWSQSPTDISTRPFVSSCRVLRSWIPFFFSFFHSSFVVFPP
ncbi:hypothetical protein VUR80DRAFT_5858 [Thermomyces stellatus]